MNLDQALVLLAGAYGAIFLVNAIIGWLWYSGDPDDIPVGLRVVVCVLVAIGVVHLVAASEWGTTAIVDGRPLDKVSIAGLFLVGLFLAFVEAGIFAGLDKLTQGLSNIGFNQPKRVPASKRPPAGTTIEPKPPTGDDPMPDFTGDNATVEAPPNDGALPEFPASVTGT